MGFLRSKKVLRFALIENIDFMMEKLDKWWHSEAWRDGVREIRPASSPKHRVYDSDSDNEGRV